MSDNKSNEKKSKFENHFVGIVLPILLVIFSLWYGNCERNKDVNRTYNEHKTDFRNSLQDFYVAINETPTDIKSAKNSFKRAKEINNKYEIDRKSIESARIVFDSHERFIDSVKICKEHLKMNNLKAAKKTKKAFTSLLSFARIHHISDSLDAQNGIILSQDLINKLLKPNPPKALKVFYNSVNLSRNDILYQCVKQLIKDGSKTSETNEIKIYVKADKIELNENGETRVRHGTFSFVYGNIELKDNLKEHYFNSSPKECDNKIKKDICNKIKNKIGTHE